MSACTLPVERGVALFCSKSADPGQVRERQAERGREGERGGNAEVNRLFINDEDNPVQKSTTGSTKGPLVAPWREKGPTFNRTMLWYGDAIKSAVQYHGSANHPGACHSS